MWSEFTLENSSSFIFCSADTNNLAMAAKRATETKNETDKSIATLHFKGGQQEAENTS